MANTQILKNIKKLLELTDYNIVKNRFAKREDAALKYLKETKDEVDEAIEEYKKENHVYLEDELGDIFWDYLQALKILERDGYISSAGKVLSHSLQKFQERLDVLDSTEDYDKQVKLWMNVKKQQKQRLKEEHQKKYLNKD